MRLTRRERLGLLALLIVCALIIGLLAFRRPAAALSIEASEELIEAEKVNEVKNVKKVNKTETEKFKNAKNAKNAKKAKKTPTPPPAPRRHLEEPF